MVAAATAVERGAKVIVLEKMAMLGGNTARSEGNMSAMDPNPEKLLDMTQAVRDIVTKYTSMKPCNKAVSDLQETVKKQLAAHDAAGKSTSSTRPNSLRCRRSRAVTATATRSLF